MTGFNRGNICTALLAAGCLVLGLGGCDDEAVAGKLGPEARGANNKKAQKGQTRKGQARKGQGQKGQSSPGTIVGTVSLDGKAPERKPLARDTDPVCARTPRLSEDVVTGEGGALRDVHVRIAVGTAGTHSAPAEPVRVTQHQCMYTPRVVGVMVGQDVAIENGDPTYHNVRGATGKRTLWNLGQPPKAPAIVREDLGPAGEVVSLHCDVHPWMQAYAVITDHPYFDVTGDDGAFAIKDLPAGEYTLEAWHPTLGKKSRTVKLGPGAEAEVRFQFSAP